MRSVHTRIRTVATWALVIVATAGLVACQPAQEPGAADATAVAAGEELYLMHCAACHGEEGRGTSVGPPLVHQIYEPGHHPDESFRQAVRRGVSAHHWAFGPMPPIPAVTDEQVDSIVAYVRELQVQAGID